MWKPIVRAAALLAAGVGLLVHAEPGAAQNVPERARAILDRGIEAAGGWAAISKVGEFREKLSVVQTVRGQESRPMGEVTPQPPRIYAVSSGRDPQSMVADVFPNESAPAPLARIVAASGAWFVVRIPQNTVMDLPDPTPFDGLRSVATFAPAVLRDARQHAATLRVSDGGQTEPSEEAISFDAADGVRTTMVFSSETGRLLRIERPKEHPLFGDLTLRVAFDDYRPVAGLVVPYRVTADLPNVFHVEATCLDVTPGAPFDAALLQRPEGARPDPMSPATDKRSEEPFPGIHNLLNVVPGYNALYVEQDHGAYVIEAPGGPATSEEILADVAAHVPGKPVRALVLTHHHYDHSAGLRTYIERGIPVITTPGDSAFVETVAAAARTLDGVRVPAKPAKIDLVRGRKTIGSGPNRFELIDVGPNPHADEILIAYFPERRMMYVPDVYGYLPGFTPPPLLLSFAERLDSLGLDVETVLTAHTDPDTMEGLRKMVEQVRARGGR